MIKEITRKQIEILHCIDNFIKENGYSPSIRDLCNLSGRTSPATIHMYIRCLREKGYIDYVDGLARSIVIKKIESEDE
jgi:repressor LexA